MRTPWSRDPGTNKLTSERVAVILRTTNLGATTFYLHDNNALRLTSYYFFTFSTTALSADASGLSSISGQILTRITKLINIRIGINLNPSTLAMLVKLSSVPLHATFSIV